MQLVVALRYSSNLPIRLVLAMTSLLWALALFVAPASLDSTPYYAALCKTAPRPFWAGMFLLNSMALWWRIIAVRPRVVWARLVNSWTFALYLVMIVASSISAGYFVPSNAAELMLCLMALWATLRTDLTQGDRETA